jgi:hypothetical protein
MGATANLPNTSLWRDLYIAALFERNTSNLPDRIAKAEAALVHRARELFYSPGDHIEEEEALDDAMYALQALRSTYQCARPTSDSQNRAA